MAELYGMSDPEFIAMLGGLLFLNKEFGDAEKVFREAYRANVNTLDRRRTKFVPIGDPNTDDPLKLVGQVVSTQPGQIRLLVPGYPRILSLFTHIAGRRVQRNDNVRFEIVFNAEGPLAIRLSDAN
jgi:hypothetical protein